MAVVLTSNFPSTRTPMVVDVIRRTAAAPRVLWIPPSDADGRRKFAEARSAFASFGVTELEPFDFSTADGASLSSLAQYDAVYLTGGDPVRFRRSIFEHALDEAFRTFAASGGVVVAASGGSLVLTPNISVFRLLNHNVHEVLAERGAFGALSVVAFEFLPHLDRQEPAFLESVRTYSRSVGCDIVALKDGDALIDTDGALHFSGGGIIFRSGVEAEV